MLPESMYDYRDNDDKQVRYIGDCHQCGREVYSNEDYRYINGALLHDDNCADEYMDEENE